MATLEYPPSLPGPRSADIQTNERRLRTADEDGFRVVRNVQRDRIASQPVSFCFSTEEAAIFQTWWKDELEYGGARFLAHWPLPEGGSAVRRFTSPPRWGDFQPLYGWPVSIDCEVYGRAAPPNPTLSPYVDCDLLLHFDEADPTLWEDYSLNRRAVVVQERSSDITGIPGGAFGRQAFFDQIAPGRREDIYYESHASLRVAGVIDFGSANFLMSVRVNLLGLDPPTAWTYTILDARSTDAKGIFWCIRLFGGQFQHRASFAMADMINVREPFCPIPNNLTGEHWLWVARVGDSMYAGYDNTIGATPALCSTSEVVSVSTRNHLRVGAFNVSSSESSPQLIDSFHGYMEELFIAHGPTWGFNTAQPIPTEPYHA